MPGKFGVGWLKNPGSGWSRLGGYVGVRNTFINTVVEVNGVTDDIWRDIDGVYI
jgi:hypothetical protein